jgi:protein-L-isoaspartate(D-aspartate) O-methyltransferase
MMTDEKPYASERHRMVDTQVARRGIRDKRVLEALRTVPRHLFVAKEYRHMAYTDGPLPIGSGQTISQPYIVALMTDLLSLTGNERVLEIGTGSGYQAAILGVIAREIHTIERHASLAGRAEGILEELGLENVHVHIGDGTLGLPEHAPFDAIVVTAAAPRAPKALLDQLEQGGRLVIPVGSLGAQFLERWTREGEECRSKEIIPVAFVPLIGEQGWNE